MAVVVRPKASMKTERRPPVLRSPVCELMSGPIVNTHRNVDVPVDVEWPGESLGKYIHKVIVGVRPVVKHSAKRCLPLLGLNRPTRVGSMKYEALKIHLPEIGSPRANLEGRIHVIANAVRSLQEADFRIEVATDFSVAGDQFKPVGIEIQRCPQVCLPARKSRRSSLCRKSMQNEVFKENKAPVNALRFIKGISSVSGPFIYTHDTDVRTAAPKRAFRPHDRIVGIRIGTGRSCVHVHHT